MNIFIRIVSLEDLDVVTSIEEICFPKAEAATKESLEYRIKTFPESFLVAVDSDNNKIIGFINGCITDSNVILDSLYEPEGGHNPNGKNQTVFGLDVLPEYQRKGLASLLMRSLMEKSKKSGKEKMVLTCKENLIGFYESFGYKNYGVSESTHGGVIWYDMIAKL